MVYRLSAKKALRRVKKISNAFIFEAGRVTGGGRAETDRRLLGLFGGRSRADHRPSVESRSFTSEGHTEARSLLRSLERKDPSEDKVNDARLFFAGCQSPVAILTVRGGCVCSR
jgi:hypothetical protein